MKRLYYFGCKAKDTSDVKGHFLYNENMQKMYPEVLAREVKYANEDMLKYIDGIFCIGGSQPQGQYTDTPVFPFRIVAWWDRTGDSRYGSSSTLIGVGYESAEEMIDAAIKIYPIIMNRQPRPVKFTI